MVDPVQEETEGLEAWIVQVGSGDPLRFAEDVVAAGKTEGLDVLVVRGDMIFGEDHLRSALYHAKRAIRELRNSSDSLAMETLLYASGERQLSSAIKKMALNGEAESAVVARLVPGKIRTESSWTTLPRTRTDLHPADFVRFGFSERELETVNATSVMDLVLEKIAAVDISKK